MAVWMVRGGNHGEYEGLALDQSVAAIRWERLPDLSSVRSKEELEDIYRWAYPEAAPGRVSVQVGQLWTFKERIQLGDLIVLPLSDHAALAIAKVGGGYEYTPDLPLNVRHVRRVKWLRKDVPRVALDQDILQALGSRLTVCQIKRDRVQERIEAALEGGSPSDLTPGPTSEATAQTSLELAEQPNLEEIALDQVRSYIGRRFRSHDLARLVTALLKAQGYQTWMSPPGPDGGVDVLAGQGAMGFGSPRLCVQVKSGSQPLDVGTLRELQGTMRQFNAQQGLLVAWGGFKQTVLNEARRLFFDIRLWDSGDLLGALLDSYDRLPADLQAELPLKRIWTLVQEEE